MNIVGVGHAGCKVTKEFQNFTEYQTFFIDNENTNNYKNFIKVTKRATHEEYEEQYKNLNIKKIIGPATIVLCGSGKITGILLRLLKQMEKNKLTIIYIKPDLSSSSELEKKRERLVFGVLQQYARSNILERLYVISNLEVESALDQISISSYWVDLNKVIANTYHMLNVLQNTEPMLSSESTPPVTSKIATLGVVNYESLKEKIFYDLERPRLKKYFFVVCEETLNKEKDLLQKIRSYVKKKSQKEEKCSASFGIYSTEYKQDYVYTLHYATFVQEENIY